MSRRAVALTIVLFAFAESPCGAQDTAHFVVPGRVSVRHLSAIPWDTVPGIGGKTVVGTVGSLSLIQLRPGVASTAPDHYHTREQINVGLDGAPEVRVDSQRISLPRGTSIVVPSNVVHVTTNTGSTPIRYFEFHIVRRPDLVAPFPAMSFPRAATPARLDPAAKLVHVHDLTKPSSDSVWGKSASFTVHVMARGSTLDIADPAGEHFLYSLGIGAVVERDTRQTFDENSVVVIPPSSGRIRLVATQRLTLLDFAVHPAKP